MTEESAEYLKLRDEFDCYVEGARMKRAVFSRRVNELETEAAWLRRHLHMAAPHWTEFFDAEFPAKDAPIVDIALPHITHVAVKYRGQVWSLPAPYRHHHVFELISRMRPAEHQGKCVDDGDGHINQGFLDQDGHYLTRYEAFALARDSGQLRDGKIIGGVLTSEDLW